MNIDKNNWYILEKELTEEQYRDVAKYLVENYEEGDPSYKRIQSIAKGDLRETWVSWDVTGVVAGAYDVFDLPTPELNGCTQITYQQFLEHIKGEGNLNQDDDGWVEWANTDREDSSPVDGDIEIEVELRGGCFLTKSAKRLDWHISCSKPDDGDIIRYRVVKEPEQPSKPQPDQTDTTNLVLELKRTSELVKRFGEVTGADLYVGADGIVTIEHDCIEYEIDFDKVSEQEVQSLVDAMTTLLGWFKKNTETGGNV